MKVKICGITNREDALTAVEAGADALGFVFVESSLRYVSPETVNRIVSELPPFVTPVGVFMDAPRSAILQAVKRSGIRCIQLHGDEAPGDTNGYSLPVYKAFRVDEGFDAAVVTRFHCSAFLFDAYVPGEPGGTGKVFDWRIAAEAKRHGRIILAGGLNPENVVQAVQTVHPYAIDVNSGVEVSPGKKDPKRIRELFQAARSVRE